MVKCGACGKFLATTDCIRCKKCNATYHKACVGLAETAAPKGPWVCPECKIKIPRQDNSSTPIKVTYLGPESPVHLNDTAHNITEEFKLDLALELRSLRNELKAELKAVRDEIYECRLEISEFKATLSTFDIKVSEIESRLSALETKCAQVMPENLGAIDERINQLKAQINDRDQELLSNDIDLSGIPEQNGENLSNIVMTLSTKLGITYDERDIVRAERVGSIRRNRMEGSADDDVTTLRPRTIAVRFARRLTRDQWLRAARIRRNLTTKDIDVPGRLCNVYVNERLSPINRRLFFLARQAGKQHKWKHIWSREGNILARKLDEGKVELIRCEKDLSRIF